MRLYLSVKQAGSCNNFISKEEIVLDLTHSTLRELIKFIVTKNVKEFNENIKKERLVDYLTNKEIEDKAEAGKVSFGNIYNDSKQNFGKALDSAYLAYEDGIYKVFIGDKEAGKLDEDIVLKDYDTLTFIKFTMLVGGLW
jgi:hypothetical protein